MSKLGPLGGHWKFSSWGDDPHTTLIEKDEETLKNVLGYRIEGGLPGTDFSDRTRITLTFIVDSVEVDSDLLPNESVGVAS